MPNRKKVSERTKDGSVMPLVIFCLLFVMLSVYGYQRTYRNQIYLYEITANHYKAQTFLTYSDELIKKEKAGTKENEFQIRFDGGTVFAERKTADTVYLVVQLDDYSYKESKELQLTEKENSSGP